MKRLLLASAACLALATPLPVMAQNSPQGQNGSQPMQQSQTLKTGKNQQQAENSPRGQNTSSSAKNGYSQKQAQAQPQEQNGAQPMQQNQAANAQKNQQQAQVINPSSLNKQDIKQIQENLNKAGFDAAHVDGIWGPQTSDALRNFQQAKHITASGELNQQTLAALNVNVPNEGRAASESNNNNVGSSQNSSAHPMMQNGSSQPMGANAPSSSGTQQPK